MWVNKLRQELMHTIDQIISRSSLVLFQFKTRDACHQRSSLTSSAWLSSDANFWCLPSRELGSVKKRVERDLLDSFQQYSNFTTWLSRSVALLVQLQECVCTIECNVGLLGGWGKLSLSWIYAQCLNVSSLATFLIVELTFSFDVCWRWERVGSSNVLVASMRNSWVFNVETTITFGREREWDRRRIFCKFFKAKNNFVHVFFSLRWRHQIAAMCVGRSARTLGLQVAFAQFFSLSSRRAIETCV